MNNPALNALRYHVTGAIKRGEAVAVVAQESAPSGRAYITCLHLYAETFQCSPAMRALNDHACDWLLTIDGLVCEDGLSLEDAARAADAGFRGDSVKAARRFLATL